MQKLTYTNTRGDSLTFGMTHPIVMGHIDGVGELDARNQALYAAGQDGAYDYGSTLERRELTLECTLMPRTGRSDMYGMREDIARVLNPKLDGVITYENDFGAWRIEGRPQKLPVWGTRFGDHLPFVLYFDCPSPFWEDHEESKTFLGHGVGGLSFPFTLPVSFTRTIIRRDIPNSGHVETPLLITFTGPAINPAVLNETAGTVIQVERTVDAGCVLEMNTDPRRSFVRIRYPDGSTEDATGWLSPNSDFIKLAPGENTIRFTNDNSAAANKVTLSYRARYTGV